MAFCRLSFSEIHDCSLLNWSRTFWLIPKTRLDEALRDCPK